MKVRTALLLVAAMCSVVLIGFLSLIGCSSKITPPPPPTLNAYFSWGAVNNPFPACAKPPEYSSTCNEYLVLLDKTTGSVVANIWPPVAGTFSTPAPAGAQHQYSLYTHIQNPDGTSSDSEQTLAVSLTQ